MLLKKMFISLLFAGVFCVSSVFAGPFGIDMGMTLDEVKQICKKEPNFLENDVYEITPPNTNNSFEIYFITIDPTFGVYSILAKGRNINTNDYGEPLISTFEKLIVSIERTYGKYEKTNSLERGSIWGDPQHYMYALAEGHRSLYAVWAEKYQSRLPDDIVDIELEVIAESSSYGYVVLRYYLSNGSDVASKADDVF